MPAADPATRFPFTEARLRDWPAQASGRVRLRDATCPGLACYVTPEGRNFYYYGKANGRPVEIRLGGWPTLTVEEARKLVKNRVAPDPAAAAEARRAKREAQTLADAWAALESNPTRRRDGAPLRPATWRGYREAWEHLRPVLGSRPLSEITGEAVVSLRGTLLRKHGPAQTRRDLALLVSLLGGRMPRDAHGRTIQKPGIEPRRRYLDAIELGALLRGLEAEPHLWKVFWLCALLAPLRRGNLARARWTDLNLDPPARWMVAAENAKGRRLLAMPICDPLAAILRDWREKNPGEWVFPASATVCVKPGAAHVVNPLHAWRRALLLAEAVRLCDAIAPHEGTDGRSRFQAFLADLDRLRVESWTVARARMPMERTGTPLARAVAMLRETAQGHGIDPAPLAMRDMTPHDLRRTAASWAVQSGASMAIVAAALGHRDQRMAEAHYAHLSDDPVRRMLADNAGRLLATVSLIPSPEVSRKSRNTPREPQP
jgi:integrase